MKQNAAGNTATTGIALNKVAKIVDVNVRVAEGKQQRLSTPDTKGRERWGHAKGSGERKGRIHSGRRRGRGVGGGLRDGRRELQGGWIHIGRRHPGIKGVRVGRRVL
jgi:hypothetical protein